MTGLILKTGTKHNSATAKSCKKVTYRVLHHAQMYVQVLLMTAMFEQQSAVSFSFSACRLSLINPSPKSASTLTIKATGKKQKLGVIIKTQNVWRKLSFATGPCCDPPPLTGAIKQTSWVRSIIHVPETKTAISALAASESGSESRR